MGTCALARTRGQGGAGGRAFRGLTRSATEWSAARRKPVRAAAMHRRAAIFADEQARRLPTSGRRKLPSGNFRSARDPEGAERVNPRKPRPPPPSLSPFARNRGMSPLLARAAAAEDALARFRRNIRTTCAAVQRRRPARVDREVRVEL